MSIFNRFMVFMFTAVAVYAFIGFVGVMLWLAVGFREWEIFPRMLVFGGGIFALPIGVIAAVTSEEV